MSFVGCVPVSYTHLSIQNEEKSTNYMCDVIVCHYFDGTEQNLSLIHIQMWIRDSKKSLTEGKVTEEAINAACRRILEAKYKLGLFDNPYKYCDVKRARCV